MSSQCIVRDDRNESHDQDGVRNVFCDGNLTAAE